jgi:hypothetical protein
LFETGEKQLNENAKFFRLFMEIKPYLKHMSSNGLKDSEWDVRIMYMILIVGGCQLFKSGKQLQNLEVGSQRPPNDLKLDGGSATH